MQQQKMTLTVPKAHHESFAAELAKLDHVEPHSENKPGIIRPLNTGGLVLEYHVGEGEEIPVHVVENPADISFDEIKSTLAEDPLVKHFGGTVS